MAEQGVLIAEHYKKNKDEIFKALAQGVEFAKEVLKEQGKHVPVSVSFNSLAEATQISPDALEETLRRMWDEQLIVRLCASSYRQDEFVLAND